VCLLSKVNVWLAASLSRAVAKSGQAVASALLVADPTARNVSKTPQEADRFFFVGISVGTSKEVKKTIFENQ